MWELVKSENLKDKLDNLLKELIIHLNTSGTIFAEESFSTPEGIMRAWLIGKMLVNENLKNSSHPMAITPSVLIKKS